MKWQNKEIARNNSQILIIFLILLVTNLSVVWSHDLHKPLTRSSTWLLLYLVHEQISITVNNSNDHLILAVWEREINHWTHHTFDQDPVILIGLELRQQKQIIRNTTLKCMIGQNTRPLKRKRIRLFLQTSNYTIISTSTKKNYCHPWLKIAPVPG